MPIVTSSDKIDLSSEKKTEELARKFSKKITSPPVRKLEKFLANSLVVSSEDISIKLFLIAISIWFERTFCPNTNIVRLFFR